MEINENGLCLNGGVDLSTLPIVPEKVTEAPVLDSFDYVSPVFSVGEDGRLTGGNPDAHIAYLKLMDLKLIGKINENNKGEKFMDDDELFKTEREHPAPSISNPEFLPC